MPAAEETVTLLFAMLKQKMPDGAAGGIDWAEVANTMGLESASAASKRWSRLKIEMASHDGVMPGMYPIYPGVTLCSPDPPLDHAWDAASQMDLH